MGQVMKYWRWPVHGMGSNSYSWENDPNLNWTYGTLSADFENTYYDWDNMPKVLLASSTQSQINAVSTLLYHCGVAIHNFYNYDGNGSTTAYLLLANMEDGGNSCAENAFYTYFRYKNTVRGLCRDNYDKETWVEMLKNELLAGRPVIYQGYHVSDTSTSGHCFVVDGYDDQDLFHINWGWSGFFNASYAIDA